MSHQLNSKDDLFVKFISRLYFTNKKWSHMYYFIFSKRKILSAWKIRTSWIFLQAKILWFLRQLNSNVWHINLSLLLFFFIPFQAVKCVFFNWLENFDQDRCCLWLAIRVHTKNLETLNFWIGCSIPVIPWKMFNKIGKISVLGHT